MSEDHGQAIFEAGEELADLLAYLDGCEAALVALLDEDLARRPDQGRPVLAVLEAQRRFRMAAAAQVRAVTLQAARIH